LGILAAKDIPVFAELQLHHRLLLSDNLGTNAGLWRNRDKIKESDVVSFDLTVF